MKFEQWGTLQGYRHLVITPYTEDPVKTLCGKMILANWRQVSFRRTACQNCERRHRELGGRDMTYDSVRYGMGTFFAGGDAGATILELGQALAKLEAEGWENLTLDWVSENWGECYPEDHYLEFSGYRPKTDKEIAKEQREREKKRRELRETKLETERLERKEYERLRAKFE